MLFFVTKDYYSHLDLKLFKIISTKIIAYIKREIRDTNSYLDKLQALRKFLHIKLQ